MSIKSSITCPDCGTPIHIESSLLLAGHKFSCSNKECSVSISISTEDIEKVSRTYKDFEDMRDTAIRQSGYSE